MESTELREQPSGLISVRTHCCALAWLRIDILCQIWRGRCGYQRRGWEVMYNGHTGRQLQAQIFLNPTYYQRLKHMVGASLPVHSASSRPAQPPPALFWQNGPLRRPAQYEWRCCGFCTLYIEHVLEGRSAGLRQHICVLGCCRSCCPVLGYPREAPIPGFEKFHRFIAEERGVMHAAQLAP